MKSAGRGQATDHGDKSATFKPLESLLRARSLAIVGATEQRQYPTIIYRNLRKSGFEGDIYAINPNYDFVWGERCFADFSSLPCPVDHAVVIVPAAAVLPALTDGAKAGLRSATIYAAGIGEGADADALKRGTALRDLCVNTGLIVAGPNCMGANSWREKLFLYPNRQLADSPAGTVAGVFQSGGTVQIWVNAAIDRGLRFSYAISSGNEINVDLADYVNFLVDDPDTKVIVLFIEAIRRPEAFMSAAQRALVAGKPIIAFKTARSPQGQSAALTHTGAIAGDYSVYSAMCKRYGIVNCRSFDDLLETTLAFQAGRLPEGRRIGVLTTSGAMIDMLHDTAANERATFARFSASTRKKLKPLLQAGLEPKNPLDSGIPKGLEATGRMLETILADPNVDMVAWSAWLGRGDLWNDTTPIRRLLQLSDKPLLGCGRMHFQMTEAAVRAEQNLGIAFLQGLDDGVRAMNALADYAERKGEAIPCLPRSRPLPSGERAIEQGLRRSGIALPKSRFAVTPKEAANAARQIGFPVVAKIVSPDVSHKTEVGGVRIGLESVRAVENAANEMRHSFRRKAPKGARLKGFLIQQMITGIEAFVGIRSDAQFGPIMAIGCGGILVEIMGDVSLRMLPVTRNEVAAMIGETKLARFLAGIRGAPPADKRALIRAIVGASRFYLTHRTHISELEINPLIVLGEGRGVVAADIRLVRNSLSHTKARSDE